MLGRFAHLFLVACLAGLIAAGLCAAPAGAASSVSNGDASISIVNDTPVIGPATRFLRATVTLTTGLKPTRVVLKPSSPSFTRFLGGRTIREGKTLRSRGIERTTGPVTFFGSGGGSESGTGICLPAESEPQHGVPSEYSIDFVQLPAASTATVEYLYEVPGDAPWLNTDYSPMITVLPASKKDNEYSFYKPRRGFSSFQRLTELSGERPLVTAPLAARVDLNVTPKPRYAGFEAYFGPVAPQKPLKLSGRLVPPRADYPIRLWSERTNSFQSSSPRHLIARVKTDSAGNFSYNGWRPRRTGDYAITADFPGTDDADLLPDSGCAISLLIEKAKRRAER